MLRSDIFLLYEARDRFSSRVPDGFSASVFGLSRVELRHITKTSTNTLQVCGGVLLHGA